MTKNSHNQVSHPEEVVNLAFRLSQSPGFRDPTIYKEGRPDLPKIAYALNNQLNQASSEPKKFYSIHDVRDMLSQKNAFGTLIDFS